MSTISADVFRAKTAALETPAIYPVRGSSKAWVNLNGIGVIAVRDSLNIASVVDVAAGRADYNLTNSFAALTYAITVATNHGASGSAYGNILWDTGTTVSKWRSGALDTAFTDNLANMSSALGTLV